MGAFETLGALGALQSRGMESVQGGAGMAYTEIMRHGFSRAQAKNLERLAGVYCTRTRSSRMQAAAVAHATETGKSVAQLLLIEKQMKKLKNKNNAWPMRQVLCKVRDHDGDISREASRLLDEWNPAPTQDTDTTPTARFADVKNMLPRRLVMEADEHTLRQRELEARDYARKNGVTLGQAVEKLLLEGTGPVRMARTTIIVGHDEATQIERGDGDDIIVGLTDGSRVRGAELARQAFLVHPEEGAVDAYRFRRTATKKQRIMCAAESPHVCLAGLQPARRHLRNQPQPAVESRRTY